MSSNLTDKEKSGDDKNASSSDEEYPIIDGQDLIDEQRKLATSDGNENDCNQPVLDDDEKSNADDEDCNDKKHSAKCNCSEIIDDDSLKDEQKDWTDEERKENKAKAETLKNEANEKFKQEEYQEALELYTKALKLCPVDGCDSERAIFFANRAAAKIQLGSKKSALEDCTMAVKCNPNYVRARMRRAKLFEELKKWDESLEDYKKINELDPSIVEARAALVRLPPLINERNEKMKTEVLDKLKDLGNMILKPFGLSTNNFQMKQDPNTGGYSVNFNQNAES